MKYIPAAIIVFLGLLFVDSVGTHFIFNKKMNEIPALEKQIKDLSQEKDKLKTDYSKAVTDNNNLRNENLYLRRTKSIIVPEYNVIEYGNQELLDDIDELESENEELKNKLEEEGRLLRYVYLMDGTFFNLKIIQDGYAYAYTKYPVIYMEDFVQAQREARENNRGLWGDINFKDMEEK